MSNVLPEAAAAEAADDRRTGRRRTWVLFWTGVTLLAAGPGVGWFGTVFGMLDSYRVIEGQPAPTPDQLAVGVHFSQFSAAAGMLLGLAGLALTGVALVGILRMNRRTV